jgi:lambda repressor-like predicted transcriptional regulator
MITDDEPKGMHPIDIQAALKKRGITQRSIADEIGVTEAVIGFVIFDKSRSRRIAEAIAEKLEMSVDDIWPGSYPEKDE